MAEKIYILGGGFGGIYSAMELVYRIASEIDITLVNRGNFFLFTQCCTRSPRAIRI